MASVLRQSLSASDKRGADRAFPESPPVRTHRGPLAGPALKPGESHKGLRFGEAAPRRCGQGRGPGRVTTAVGSPTLSRAEPGRALGL